MMPWMVATIFVDGIGLATTGRFWLILPLCLAIAIVHKTIHCQDLRDVPRGVAPLWITIVGGMYMVGIALWGLYCLMV